MNSILLIMPALCFGSLFIIIGLIKIEDKRAILSTAIGALMASTLFLNSVSLKSLLVGLFCGFMWVIAFYYQLKVFQKLGASIAVPLTNGLQLLIASILSLTVFSEIVGLLNISKLVIYMIILILGIILVSKKENILKNKSQKNIGVYVDALISSVAFIIFMSTNKFFNISPYSLFLPQTIGMSLASLYINKNNVRNIVDKKSIITLLAGFVWFLGNYSMLLSIENFGLGITVAMVQLNIVVSSILAILILKERKTKKELIYLSLGVVFIVFSGISIAMIN